MRCSKYALPGLDRFDPGIRVWETEMVLTKEDVDGRDKPGQDV